MTKKNVIAIVASLLVTALCITGVVVHTKAGGEVTETTTITDQNAVLSVEEEDSKFVVNLGECHAYDNISTELLWNSLSKEDRARTKAAGFSDAVSFPLEGKDGEAKLAEIREEILRNPIFGDMVARGFCEVKLSDGKTTLADINPWINDFIAKTDRAFKNTEIGTRGIEIWLKCGADGKYYVTEEYREYTCGLATIIDRMVIVGISSRQSELNFRLNDKAKDYDRRTIKGEIQENKDAFVLKYFRKDGTKVFEIAFNMHDRRFELLKNYVPAPKTTSKGGSGGTPTPTKGTTKRVVTTKKVITTRTVTVPKITITIPKITIPKITVPTVTYTTPKTTERKTTYRKDPAEDPVNQGNAPVGGGKNLPSDGAGTYQPTAQRPPEQTTKRVVTTQATTTKVYTTVSSGGGNVNLDNATPPATNPIPTVTDSHDKPGNNAGSGNGAFSMD